MPRAGSPFDESGCWRPVGTNTGFGVIFLELLLASDAMCIGEISVESKENVLHFRIHCMMEALDRIRAGGNVVEGRLHLRHVFKLKGDMKLSELWRAKTKLASCNAIGVKLVILPQTLKIRAHVFYELHVTHPRLEVAPNMIDIQLPPPLTFCNPCDAAKL